MAVDDVFSGMNPVVRGFLRTPLLHWLLSPFLMLLTVTGRRSGRRYTIPVGYQLDGNDVTVLVSEAPRKQWWRNFLEPRPVELHLRGRARRGEAFVLGPDAPDWRPRIEHTLRRVPRLDRVFGIEYDRSRGLDEEQAAHLARAVAVVRIELES